MVKPRPASTIVLARCLSNNKYDLYMTQRPKHFAFLGGYYVFPGGAVDDEDTITTQVVPCHWPSLNYPPIPKAFWVAAVRETFEETGLLLARNTNGQVTWDMTLEEDRDDLLHNRITFSQLLIKYKLSLDFTILKYVGRRITPADSPIRFDTRFFLAAIPETIECRPNSHEVIADEWMKPEDALSQWKNGTISLVPPTIQVLQALKQHSCKDDLHLVSIGEQMNLSS